MKKINFIFLIVLLMFMPSCKNKKNNNDNYQNMYNHLVDCWNQSLNEIHFDNAFYGDSRVIGGDFVNAFSDYSVVNLGVGGDKISDLINRFKLIKTTTPNRVFLAIGGNDCLSSSFNIDTFKSEYRTLLNLFKENNIDVVVHNIVGITTINSSLNKDDVSKGNKKITEANKFIKEIAEEMNYTFIDIASIMNNKGTNEMNGLYSADGVHFNNAGYQVWFKQIELLLN